MSDHYGQVEVQFEQVKSFGNGAEKADVSAEEQVPKSPISPDSTSITTAGRHPSITSNLKNRSKMVKDDHGFFATSDPSLNGSDVSAHVAKNLSRVEHDLIPIVKGSAKIRQGRSETNGNYVLPSKNIQETVRKRRPVTVDTAKAKTSSEALKLSIRQLKWKEV